MKVLRGIARASRLAAGLSCAACAAYPALVWPHAATTNTVIFDREIVRILDEHCVMCHHDGGPSFALATYEQTWLRRAAIHDQILGRHMPPWAAEPGYGEFANANRLTLREQRFVVSWVEGLGPRNTGTVFLNVLDPNSAPRREVEADTDFGAWRIGEPDRILSLAAPASGGADTRVARAVVDSGLRSASRLRALEFRPADRSALRAVVFMLADSGQWLATWTPWQGHRQLPAGSAYTLGPGARIAVEVHGLESAAPADALGELGLHFAPAATEALGQDVVLAAEVGADGRFRAETRLERDVEALALWPELPPGIEALEVTARHPNGKTQILLLALDIPLDWPTAYHYETPVVLPSGTLMSVTAKLMNGQAASPGASLRLTLSAR